MIKKYLSLLIILAIAEISISLYLSIWREKFYNFIELKDLEGFLIQIAIFTGLALIYCFVSGYQTYMAKLAGIEWSKKLVAKGLGMISRNELDVEKTNIRQRIEYDTSKVPDLTLNLCLSLGKALGYIIVFTIFLLLNYSFWYTCILYLYVITAHIITKKVGLPLIPLNYEQQDANATFRQALIKENFDNCIRVALGLAKKTKYLNFLQYFVAQVAVIVPLLIIAPEYFNSSMKLGALMMFSGSMGVLKENLLLPLSSFQTINETIASRRRLKEVGIL
jgi:putative ATP-binding cassette transporter